MKISFLRLSPSSPHRKIEPILFEWFTLIGMFVFAAWLLGLKGVWQLLLQSDASISIAELLSRLFRLGHGSASWSCSPSWRRITRHTL